MQIVYILVAILMFGVLIAIHEFGHFISAKLLGVKVNEFSIGMGPLLWKRQRGETQYSLRLFPVGGYCAMEGEDEDSGDPRAFIRQKGWKKFIILVAGSFMNFLMGLVLAVVLMFQTSSAVVPVLADFYDGYPNQGEEGLMVGDRILSIDGERVYVFSDISLLLSRSNGQTVDLVIEREGERITLEDFPMYVDEYQYQGETRQGYGLVFTREELGFWDRLALGWNQSLDFVRLVRMSLGDIFQGAVGLKDISGPIGIVSIISEVGTQSPTVGAAIWNIIFFVAFIAVNLSVMNLLPIPALDGGRVLFLILGGLYTLVTKKKLDSKYEAWINAVALVLLLGLMAVVALSDIWKLIA